MDQLHTLLVKVLIASLPDVLWDLVVLEAHDCTTRELGGDDPLPLQGQHRPVACQQGIRAVGPREDGGGKKEANLGVKTGSPSLVSVTSKVAIETGRLDRTAKHGRKEVDRQGKERATAIVVRDYSRRKWTICLCHCIAVANPELSELELDTV